MSTPIRKDYKALVGFVDVYINIYRWFNEMLINETKIKLKYLLNIVKTKLLQIA